MLGTTQPFYASRSEKTIIPRSPTILSSRTKHSLTRFRSSETKFLNTLFKETKKCESRNVRHYPTFLCKQVWKNNYSQKPHNIIKPYEALTNSLPFLRDKISKHLVQRNKKCAIWNVRHYPTFLYTQVWRIIWSIVVTIASVIDAN